MWPERWPLPFTRGLITRSRFHYNLISNVCGPNAHDTTRRKYWAGIDFSRHKTTRKNVPTGTGNIGVPKRSRIFCPPPCIQCCRVLAHCNQWLISIVPDGDNSPSSVLRGTERGTSLNLSKQSTGSSHVVLCILIPNSPLCFGQQTSKKNVFWYKISYRKTNELKLQLIKLRRLVINPINS